jgi:DNA-binding MarR family transcriptional regulator
MTKLSDTQVIILSAAAQRSDGNLLPLPGSLRGGAATKVVGALLTRGLIREQVTDSPRKADAALNTVWRNEDDGRGVLLFITPAGLEAIGVEPVAVPYAFNAGTNSAGEPAAGAPAAADAAPVEKKRGRPRKAAPTARDTGTPRKTRDGSKQAQLIAMLRRKQGATIAQIVEATGWQPHTVRGAFAGALKKRLGLMVTSEKLEGRGRVYRLES